MPTRKSLDHLDCAVANCIDLIGDRWALLILRDAFLGVRRFDEFQRDLGIARNILSSRLESLMEAGIIFARPYQEHPVRNEYLLTDRGKDLFDVLMALWRWGDKWESAESTRRIIHNDCEHQTHIVASCSHCGGELTRRNVRVEPTLDIIAERLASTSKGS